MCKLWALLSRLCPCLLRPRLLMLIRQIVLATAIQSQSHATAMTTSRFSQDAMWICGATTHVVLEARRINLPVASASTLPTRPLVQQRTRRYFSRRARAKPIPTPTTTMPTVKESVLVVQQPVAWGRLQMGVLGPHKWVRCGCGLFLSSHQDFWVWGAWDGIRRRRCYGTAYVSFASFFLEFNIMVLFSTLGIWVSCLQLFQQEALFVRRRMKSTVGFLSMRSFDHDAA